MSGFYGGSGKVRCTVCERLTEPSPVPAASLTRWTEFGQCVALDLYMASHYQVLFPVADKNASTVFCGILLSWCLTLCVPGAWNYRAQHLMDQFSTKWNDSSTKPWLCAVLNWSTNTAIGDSVRSQGQWVLGRSLRLPFQLSSRAHQQHRDDFAYQRRVAMLTEAQRSIISTRYIKALSRAFLSRARSSNSAPSQVRFAVGDQVMY